MTQLFFTAFIMSTVFAVQPGIVNFTTLQRGMEGGFFAALNIELGALIGDATWALLALLGAAILFQNPIVALILGLVGCVLLLRFAWDAWQASLTSELPSLNQTSENQTKERTGLRANDFLAGAALALSNPQNITFWLGMSGIIVSLGFLNPEPIHLITFFTGFMSAQIVWAFLLAALVSRSAKLLNSRAINYINFVSAIVLGYFGIDLLLETVQLVWANL